MSQHPYKEQLDRAFWSRSVTENFKPEELVSSNKKLLNRNDQVTSAGSCFASNLVRYIESAGLTYIRTEKIPTIFSNLGQNLGYANFSAAYGNIYTTRQLLQLYQRALGDFKPLEDKWIEENRIIDPFRPGLKFPASSIEEFDFLTKSHLDSTREAFETSDVFVFTLGLTEGWVSKKDGATFPACPGTIAGDFDSRKYEFKNFRVDEIVLDLQNFIDLLRIRNPKVRFILTVSPVPLVATATSAHVLTASTYSKSVLRVAAEIVCKTRRNTDYFPAYEIITGPQAPDSFFEPDKRNVSETGVAVVMEALLNSSGLSKKSELVSKDSENQNNEAIIEEISKKIAIAECDEVMLDDSI